MSKRHKQIQAAMQRQREQIPSGIIPRAAAPSADQIVFSFKYLDFSNQKFTFRRCTDVSQYFETLLDRMKHVCALTVSQFTLPTGGNRNALRSHSIDFGGDERLTERGFPFQEHLWKGHAWQFEVTSNKHGRIHGFWAGNVFFVVWFDPNHLLYS